MRVLIFHGYLLRGTGSNIYNVSLCGRWRRSATRCTWCARSATRPRWTCRPRCHVHNPDIGRVLPVYVADEYAGFDAVPFSELDDDALEHYLEANVAAVREVVERYSPDVALANHLVMGPVILARALRRPGAVRGEGARQRAGVHGASPAASASCPTRARGCAAPPLCWWARATRPRACGRSWATPSLPARTRLGPPGVDVHEFRPRPPADAAERLDALADRLERGDAAAWGGEPGAAQALRALDPARDRIVSYVGKLIVSKGVDLLLAAWPLVVAEVPRGAAVHGRASGPTATRLERWSRRLARADLDALREIAARGRELEGGPAGELTYLAAFLDGLSTARRRDAYLAAGAGGRGDGSCFTGRLEHSDLPRLLPACEAQVVPSTFPEAFGMVAAEAAACGALPLSAAHSGLAEVTATLAERAGPEDLRPLLSFERGPGAVEEIAAKLVALAHAGAGDPRRGGGGAGGGGPRRYGWEAVAEGVIAAAQGRLDELPEPGA